MPMRPLVRLLIPALIASFAATPLAAQRIDDNPVYVDDSPQAWELYRRAQDQAADNPSEAARLYQQLLDDYAYRLIPRREGADDQMLSVRARVHSALREQPVVLERYRLLQTAEAERLAAADEFDTLVRTRFFTAPALDAVLRLTQRDLEAARFRRALDRLRDAEYHPDLTGRAQAFYWFMLSLAAHHAGDPLTATDARQQLERLGEPVARTLRPELDRLLDVVAEPDLEPVFGPGLTAPPPEFESIHEQPIWSMPLEQSLVRRAFAIDPANNPSRSSLYQANRHNGGLLTAVPTLVAQTVYINEGHRVRAIDRFSQRVLWSRSIGRSDAQPSPGDFDPPADLNTIVIEGDALVTLTGHGRQSYRSGRGEVVCLDRRSGEVRWRVDLDMLNGRSEFERLFPHGSPIVAEGTVYVLARKPTRELLSSCYLVALDLGSGELRWARYIAASSGLQREDVRPITSPLYDDGELFVSTPLGAIAGVSASTGEVRWLKRYTVPIIALPRTRVPWDIAAPVMSPRGLVALTPDQRSVVLVDRETGDELERYDTVNLGSPRYLLADEFSVYAVGESIFAYSQEDLSVPRWVADRSALGEMRGRVQLARGGLIVPTAESVMQLDDVTGMALAQLPVTGGGNPLAVGPQLFLAGTDELRSYMAIGVAEDMLRERIVERPRDPEPALSLLRLAMRAGDLALGLDAADAVMTVLERQPQDAVGRGAARSELFEQLISFDRIDVKRTREQGDALHARLTMVAETTSERVRQMLARGEWLRRSAEGDRARQHEAAATFDAILEDEALARATFTDDAVIRPARDAATARLNQLVTAFGPEALGEIRETGRARLAEATAAGDAAQLAAMVARYPMLPESTEATIRAATGLEQAGRSREAIALLMNRAQASGATAADRLYGAIVELAVRRGWNRLAVAWLDRARADAGLTDVRTVAGSRAIDTWRRELAPNHDASHRPALGDFQEEATTQRFPGRVLTPLASDRVSSRDAYLLQGETLARLTAPDLEVQWTSELPNGRASLIDRIGSHLLLRLEGDIRRMVEPSLVVLNDADGTAAWTKSNLLSTLYGVRDPDRLGSLLDEVMPNGRVFDPREVIPLVDDDRLLLIGRLAGMMAIDPARGAEPTWLIDHGLSQVHFARAHDLAIVLAGHIEAPAGGRPQPIVRFFDPQTGELLDEIRPEDNQSLRWITVADDGRVAFGTNSAVELYSLASGARRWANLSDLAPDTADAWPTTTGFLVQDANASIRALANDTGRIDEPVVVPGGDWFPSDLQGLTRAADAWLAHYRDRVLYFDERGRLSGRDAIVEDRNYTHIIPARDRVIVVSHIRRPRSVIPRPGRSPSLFVDRLYVLSTNGMVIGGRDVESESAPLAASGAVDGWILLSSDQSTVAVPAPSGAAPPGGAAGQ